MMHKLRIKFIRIAMAALAAVVILVAAAINIMNWVNVRAEIGETISFLAESDGMVSLERANQWAGKDKHRKNILTQSVYFMGRTLQNGSVQVMNQGRMSTVNTEEAQGLLERASASGRESGFLEDYFFQRFTSGGNTLSWIFLDCDSYLSASRNLLLFSVIICIAGILLSLLFVSLLSKKAIQPFVRNEQKQKRFITDASHELKAPLAVISANMDVLALKEEENDPWIDSTRNQGSVFPSWDTSRAESVPDRISVRIAGMKELASENSSPSASAAGRERSAA